MLTWEWSVGVLSQESLPFAISSSEVARDLGLKALLQMKRPVVEGFGLEQVVVRILTGSSKSHGSTFGQ